jgi:hypothetical protein
MKKLLVALLVLMVASPALAAETAAGTIKLGGKLKWLYLYQARDGSAEGFGGDPIENFVTSNVELDVNGTVGENVSYVIELQSANFFQTDVVSGNTFFSNPNELGAIGVRQAKILVSGLIPMTTVTLGTFNLPVTNYQPRPTNDYDLIMLPLLNASRFGANAYSPIGVGWQATGVNFAVAPMDMLEFDASYFNGYAMGGANVETDLEKSWLFNLKVKPGDATVAVGYLTEGWQEDLNGGGNAEQQNASGWIVSGAYLTDRLEVNGDWITMTAKDYQVGPGGNQTDLTWMGYQATLGWWITDSFELLGRYEGIDPNTENDKDFGASAYDQLTWITAGMNYRLSEGSEVSLNYIFRLEQGDDIDVDSGKVPTNDPKYQMVDNDLFLIQVQVWQ